jgi:tetratricopeptide (TPR) repeat protein
MSVRESLSRLAFERLADDVRAAGGPEGVRAVAAVLARTEGVSDAFCRAEERAWRALEVALGDDPFWDRCQVGLPPAEARTFRRHVDTFLTRRASGGGAVATAADRRNQCLLELRAARSAGVLTGGPDRPTWGRLADVFAPDAGRRASAALIRELAQRGYPSLAKLLRPSRGLPLLVMVVRAFFCQALVALLEQGLPAGAGPEDLTALKALRRLVSPQLGEWRPARPARRTTAGGRRGDPAKAASARLTGVTHLDLPLPPRNRSASPERTRITRRTDLSLSLPPRRDELRPRDRTILADGPRPSPAAGAALALLVLAGLSLLFWWVIGDTTRPADEQPPLAIHTPMPRAPVQPIPPPPPNRGAPLAPQPAPRQLGPARLPEADPVAMGDPEEAEREKRRLQERLLAERARENRQRAEKARAAFDHGRNLAFHRDAEALEALDESLRLEPSNPAAYRERGLVRRRLRDEAGALADFTEAVGRDPRDAVSWYQRGMLHAAANDDSRALLAFTAVIDLQPDNAAAYRERGACHGRKGDYQQAVADETRALALDPKDPWAHYHRGNAHRHLKDIDRALADYSAAIDLNRDRDVGLAPAYRHRGAIHLDRRSYREAIEDYTRSLALEPIDIDSYRARGLANLELGQWTNAILDFTAVIGADPRDGQALKNRGRAHLSQGAYHDARDDFRRAVELNRRDAEAYYLCALARDKLDDVTEAIRDCNVATALDRKLAGAYELRGRLYLRQGDRDKARADREEAERLSRASADGGLPATGGTSRISEQGDRPGP